MTSYRNKGNNLFIFYIILGTAAAVLLVLCGSVMLSRSSGTGRYNNPKVATTVVSGSIYDRNGRALAVEIPSWDVYFDKEHLKDINTASQIVCLYADTTPGEIISLYNSSYDRFTCVCEGLTESNTVLLSGQIIENNLTDCVSIRKNSRREYPASVHGALLVKQTENALSDIISPKPGFNDNITYGQDITLTIDLDIQYILDMAIQNMHLNTATTVIYALISDIKTGEILAMTTFPMLDPDGREDCNQKNIAYIPQITTNDWQSSSLYFIKDNPGAIPPGYTFSEQVMDNLLKDSSHSIISALPAGNPRYTVVIATQESVEESVLEKACTAIAAGLASQGKIS